MFNSYVKGQCDYRNTIGTGFTQEMSLSELCRRTVSQPHPSGKGVLLTDVIGDFPEGFSLDEYNRGWNDEKIEWSDPKLGVGTGTIGSISQLVKAIADGEIEVIRREN